MDLGIKGKIMIVTGGSKGIGEGISRRIAEEGAVPIIATRDKESGERVTQELRDMGREACFIHAELSDVDMCKRVVDETMGTYHRIDAVINNAGTNDAIGLQNGSPENFLTSLNNNLYHYYYLVHFALDALKASKGSIVNISSKTAVTGQGNTSGYAAAKGAQLALTREWAVELLPFGIRVNAVVPAEVWTPLYEKWINTLAHPDQKLHEIEQRIPLGKRMTTKEEIASMVAYLVSDQASHITGQWIFVDGGYVHLDRALAGIS